MGKMNTYFGGYDFRGGRFGMLDSRWYGDCLPVCSEIGHDITSSISKASF